MQSRSAFLAWLDDDERAEVRRDADVFARCLADARADAAGPVAGFFGPDSMMWRIFGETAVSLGGMRAVMMQLAHPAVTAAGLQSSNFREDFVGRAWRTFATMAEIVFGELDTAADASRRLHVLHARIRGRLPPSASARRAGEPYRGTDPELLLWVLATLYEGSVFTWERLIAPLDDAERARYWADMLLLGRLLGIPLEAMPATVAELSAYWERMLAEELEAGAAGHELAAFLVRSPLDHVPPALRVAPLRRLALAWTAGSAPAGWSRALGVAGDGRCTRDFERLGAAMRAALRATPPALRRTPAYHQGLLRVQRAGGAQGSLPGRAVQRANRRWRLPMALEPVKALHGDERAILVDLFEQS